MVTYMIHLVVRHEVYSEYVEWLKTEHINEVLQCPGFISAELCLRKGGSLEASSKDVKVVYKVKDEASLKTYMSEYAMKLREKGLEKFPGQYSAQREVWLETINFESK
ncbi:DUF4286 family protein [Bdellovibrio sp. 22V]|uniref:DUF4286 family protein n=1 Tax=Bdellovibrio sp. 22V TaxID=3044166 RepID=UPI00254276B8|nr:DUF4286 family protein [Bdellovibrio sp. 22V]WII73554.1 DUF4286 family protein [Bdellovibrio sp. 22V]